MTTTFTFDGRAVETRPGQTIAAALIEAGIRDWHHVRSGSRRGLFCGMGVCQDCLVVVEGEPGRRACLTKAEPGLSVQSQPWPAAPVPTDKSAAPVTADAMPVESPDVLVIGAGAGGLCAAIAARRCGLAVTVIDERAATGGQYYKQIAPGIVAAPLDRQQQEGSALVGEARSAGVSLLQGVEVWGVFAPDRIVAFDGEVTRCFAPKTLIVATGAYERGIPLPGWTLPGVMTTGAAQTLWRSYRTLPGRRIVIAGNGPLNLQVACELAAAGAEIAAVIEAAPALSWRKARDAAALALASPTLAIQGARYLAALRRRGIPLVSGQVLLRVEQDQDGLRAIVGQPGDPRAAHRADAILMGYGFLPANEILRALDVSVWHDPRRGLVTERDENLETSVRGVFAVGDCCGLGGAAAAREEGTIAGLAAARRLGAALGPEIAALEGRAHGLLQRHRRFQDALWSLFAAPAIGLSLADSETIVCRCEEVSKARIDAALTAGRPSLARLKQETRCGMGRCQGRYCGPLLAEHLAAVQDRPVNGRAYFAPRAPVKPVAIADLINFGSRGRPDGEPTDLPCDGHGRS